MQLNKLNKIFTGFIKKLTFLKVTRFFFYAFVFCLPFNINVIIYASDIFSTGNFNPYTSFFFYLSDFFLLTSILFWAIAIFRKEADAKITYGNYLIFIILFLFIVVSEVSIIFSHDQILSILLIIRLFEFGLAYLFFINKVVSVDITINVFIVTMALQALIAIIQYLSQGAIGLSLLGESAIAPDYYGIAKMNVEDNVLLRPYGTFPHSNILAGYLFTAIFLAFYRVKQKEHIAYPILFLLIGALILTFSRAAILALIIAWFVYISVKNTKIPYKLIFLILCILSFFIVAFNLEQALFNRILFTDMSTLYERVFYFNISKLMLFAIPFGVGIGNFTYNMQDFTITKIAPWDFQPVHDIYMLIANETGIIGFLLFVSLFVIFAIYIFKKMKKLPSDLKNLGVILLSILAGYFVIGLFDHYLFSLYQGLALTFLLVALFGKYIIEENH